MKAGWNLIPAGFFLLCSMPWARFAIVGCIESSKLVCSALDFRYLCKNFDKMETLVERKQTSFRLPLDLINRLRAEAQKEHRSLNNYVESLLTSAVRRIPNETTLAAIREAETSEDLETLDIDHLKEYIASL